MAATRTAAPGSDTAAPASPDEPDGGGRLPGLIVISGQPIPGFWPRQPRSDVRVIVARTTFATAVAAGNRPSRAPSGLVCPGLAHLARSESGRMDRGDSIPSARGDEGADDGWSTRG